MGDSTDPTDTIPSAPLIAEPGVPYELMCCGGKRCPQIVADEQGNVALTDPDTGPDCINLNSEQASALRKWLERQGF